MVTVQRAPEFRWIAESRVIQAPALESERDMFAALHECGHAALGHVAEAESWVHLGHVVREAQAWAYARRCVRPDRHEALEAYALECIATYNAASEAASGEWLERHELLAVVRAAQ